MTHYTIFPCKDKELRPNSSLLVVNPFAACVRLVMLRYPGAYEYCGYVEGDGAVSLREAHACLIRVESVSEISGCGQAVIETLGDEYPVNQ